MHSIYQFEIFKNIISFIYSEAFNSDCIGVSVDSVNTIKLFFIHVIVLMHR